MGGLSLLYNNAGGSTLAPIHDYEVAEWRRIVDLNLTGVFHGFKAGAPLDPRRTAAARSCRPRRSRVPAPSAGEAPYSAAKAAVVALTASAALEYAPTIRVNAVSPGMIRTPLTELLLDDRGIGLEEAAAGQDARSTGSARPATSPTSSCSSAPTSPDSSPARTSSPTAG